MSCSSRTRRPAVGRDLYADPVFMTADGRLVSNRFDSHVAMYARRWVAPALALIDTRDRFYITEEVSFPSDIGYSIVVKTEPGDDIVYVRRPRRCGYSRCVRGKEPTPTNKFTLVIKQKEEDIFREKTKAPGTPAEPIGYVLITAWIGPCPVKGSRGTRRDSPTMPEPAPGKPVGSDAAAFWREHAFVLGHTIYWPDSLLTAPPPEWAALLQQRKPACKAINLVTTS